MTDKSMHKRLPAERFYWAMLDTETLGANPSSVQLGYLFESVLPCPVEEIHAVYARSGKGQVIACGMKREVLQRECEGALTLCPEQLPPFIAAGAVEPERLNLLVGEFEPACLTRQRRWFLAQAAAALLIVSAAVTLGLELRTANHSSQVQSLQIARSAIYDELLGPAIGSASTGPPEIRLLAELRQLRQTRTQPARIAAQEQHEDVSLSLARLLSKWPGEADEIHLQTEHISVTPGVITLRGVLPDSAEAERLAERLGSLDGWRLQQPQITSSRESVQASLRFAPQRESVQ